MRLLLKDQTTAVLNSAATRVVIGRLSGLLLLFWLSGCSFEEEFGRQPNLSKSPSMTDTNRSEAPLVYPHSPTVDQVDDYFGVSIEDPYRWLEDDVRQSDAVADWVARQNRFTHSRLESLPLRETIRNRLKKLWNYEKFGVPVKQGGRYFYHYNSGLENQSRVFLLDGLNSAPRLLFDPNAWSDDGTVALSGFYPDPTGRYVAYLVQRAGSDWHRIRIRDIQSGKDLPEVLEWMKFTQPSWRRDGSGFYYSRYPESDTRQRFQALNQNQRVYFHRVSTPQQQDIEIYATPDHPEWGHSAEVTPDDRFLVITTWLSTDYRYQISWIDLSRQEHRVLIPGFVHGYSFVGNHGNHFIFRTNDAAPLGRVIEINLENPAPGHWRELVPEQLEQQNVLEQVSYLGGYLVASYLSDAHSAVRVFDLEGKLVRQLHLPGTGTVHGFEGEPDQNETFFSYSSLNQPPIIYRHLVTSGESRHFRESKVSLAPGDFEVKEVFFPSKDGTRIHMFVAHKKGLRLNGNNPTLLYGYGGFNISLTPEFSVPRRVWMEMGGVFAMPNLRGGGEYGEAWHQAGTRTKKQNVFDDFIGAAECLIREGYTRPAKLAIEGRSNGGLLVGAVLNQRPDLFAVALPAVGVMDMLRFQHFTSGRLWTDDYGSSDNPEEFKALLAYSPYHNLKQGIEYPAVLITTADTDDRVVPGHSFKYAARLQQVQAGNKPILIRIENRAGHGLGTPTRKLIDQYADMWAFAAEYLGLDDSQLPGSHRGE